MEHMLFAFESGLFAKNVANGFLVWPEQIKCIIN